MKDKNLSRQVYKKELLLFVIKHKRTSNIKIKRHEFHLRPSIGPGIYANATFYIVIYIKFEDTISLDIVQ